MKTLKWKFLNIVRKLVSVHGQLMECMKIKSLHQSIHACCSKHPVLSRLDWKWTQEMMSLHPLCAMGRRKGCEQGSPTRLGEQRPVPPKETPTWLPDQNQRNTIIDTVCLTSEAGRCHTELLLHTGQHFSFSSSTSSSPLSHLLFHHHTSRPLLFLLQLLLSWLSQTPSWLGISWTGHATETTAH